MAEHQQTITVVEFNDLAPKTQAAVAEAIRAEMEQRTSIRTRSVSEWVRVMAMVNPKLEINHATRKMNVSPDSKPLLEQLVQAYLVVGVSKEGRANG